MAEPGDPWSLPSRAKRYQAQQEELQEKCHQAGEDVFVASFKVLRQDSGALLCCTTWAPGVDVLLPKVDLVLLLGGGEDDTFFVPWTELHAVCAARLDLTAEDPERWRAHGYPDVNELSQLRARALAAGL